MSISEKARKYDEIVKAWESDDFEVIDFMRKLSEIIDGKEKPNRVTRK